MSDSAALTPGTSSNAENAGADSNTAAYVPDGDGYRCGTCGTTILAATVTRSVHLPGGQLGGMAGFGEVEREQVPYCPNCEGRPSPYGSPVYYD